MASSANNRKRTQGSQGRSGASRPRRETPVEEALREEKEREMKVEIGTIAFIALMVFLFLCNFHIIGKVGDAISGFMFGVFGLLAYVTPVFAAVALLFYRANNGNRSAMRKFWTVIGLYFLVGIICDMAQKTAVGMEKYNFGELYKLGSKGRCGGGLVSGSIAYLIKHFLGNVGLVLLLILGIIICLILLTEKSFINMIYSKGAEFTEKGKQWNEERKERRELERQERALIEDKRAQSGAIAMPGETPEKALNVRDKLRQTDAQAPLFEEGTYVDMPVLPAAPELNTGYKPNIRESMKSKLQASMEKHAEDRKLHQEARENESILQVAPPESIPGAVFGNQKVQDIHEVTYMDADVNYPQNNDNGYYSDQYDPNYDQNYSDDNGYSDGYYEDNGEQYPEQLSEEEQIRRLKIQNGETIVDMYGRPVFNFEKQPIRSSHNVEVTDEFGSMDGSNDAGQVDYYNDDENILSNNDDDILSTYERSTREAQERERLKAEREAAARAAALRESVHNNPVNVDTYEQTKLDIEAAYVEPTPSFSRKKAPALDRSELTSYDRPKASLRDETAQAPAPKPAPAYSNRPYRFPPISLLNPGSRSGRKNSYELEETKKNLQNTLHNFGVNVEITEAVQGPSVTRYEMTLEPGTKVSKILGLADDIKLSLASADIRIEAPIPGKSAVGIEVPNKETSMVTLRELFESRDFKEAGSTLSFAVGKNIGGDVIVTDIGKMPHVLIAGATGSGKSVCINTLIMSLIYKATPEEVQMIMIDPKVVELSVYNGIPHLMLPVVTDPKKASAALAWGVKEMEDRYKKFADLGVRDLKGYNDKVSAMSENELNEAQLGGISHFKLPKIVIIIDELADLMMVCGKEVEEAICRLAQLARACGIHLVVATQRPSVDVITGLIKANMPSRMAFAVSSGVDSRTILDSVGAEKLLGKGDMLFYPQGKPKPERVQGAFVSDEEVSKVVDFLKDQRLRNDFAERVGVNIDSLESSSDSKDGGSRSSSSDDGDGRDELFAEAGRCIINSGKCSIGYLQRMLKIGFNRAARIMDSLSEEGVVGPESGTKAREILMTIEEFEAFLDS
jgi:S-DNA-T family DNA segregation ATPase FtsK/SpoIIIE